MPKLVNKKPGKRINIYLTDEVSEVASTIDNLSKFFQLCLKDAAGIMTWAILREEDPEKYKVDPRPAVDIVGKFNEVFPLDPLTAKRLNKEKPLEEEALWPANSPKKPELW